MVFKLPRAGRAFIKGLASEGYRGIMAKAQAEADALKTEQEQEFELLKIKDRAHLNKLTQIELLNLKDENAAKALKRAEEKVVNETRSTLSEMGWQNNTLDYLESKQILNNGLPSFNVWLSQFNYDKPDFHIQTLSTTDGKTISWQDDFLNQAKKSTNVINSSNVASTLENQNGLSSNVAKSQVDTTGATTATDTSNTGTTTTTDTSTETTTPNIMDLPAQTMDELRLKQDAKNNITADTSSTEVGASVTLDAPASWQDRWKEKQIIPQKVITLGVEDRGNADAEKLLGAGFSLYNDIPDDGTKKIKLTFDNQSGTYNQTIVTVGQTLTEKNNNLNTRQTQLMTSLLQQPFWGLTNEAFTQLATGGRVPNQNATMSMTPENQVKFSAMQDSLLFLNDYYTSIGESIMPAKLVSQVVKLYDINNSKDGLGVQTGTEINKLTSDDIETIGNEIVGDLSAILKVANTTAYGTTGLDTNNRNKVIEKEVNTYKASLLATTGNPRHIAIVDEVLKAFERGNNDGNYWDEVSDDRDPSGTFEQGIDFDPTEGTPQDEIQDLSDEEFRKSIESREPTSVDMKDVNTEINQMANLLSADDLKDSSIPEPKITIEFDGNVSNYDLSKIDIGETKTSGARAGTQNVNPNVAKFRELKKKIKILNQLERATSNKGEKYRTKQIPILKKEIEELILELQGE